MVQNILLAVRFSSRTNSYILDCLADIKIETNDTLNFQLFYFTKHITLVITKLINQQNM
jgi:hypothetical protein